MGKYFEEIDSRETPLGRITLSRRRIAMLQDRDVFEIKLNEEFLMSSLFFDSEVALATLGMRALKSGGPLSVVVGGLGLGFTAKAALADARLENLLVVDYLEPVIQWHREGLVPLGRELSEDPRCRFVHADFFALAADPARGFDPEAPGRRFDAILLDIDHSPRHVLNEAHGSLYTPEGLQALRAQLRDDGVFALWSNDPPDEEFMVRLRAEFATCDSQVIEFDNPLQDAQSRCTVYVAKKKA